MDLPYIIISIISMLIVGFLYFKTKTKRLNAHHTIDSQGKKRTFIPQSNLSIGAALVILGIIMDIGNRSANYILIGIGVILAIVDANKILSK
jgi:transposase